MGDARQPPGPPSSAPDFVLREDGELVATRDVTPEEVDSLVEDLLLDGAAPRPHRPEDAVRSTPRNLPQPPSPPAGPPRGHIPRAPTNPALRFAPASSASAPAAPPVPPPPGASPPAASRPWPPPAGTHHSVVGARAARPQGPDLPGQPGEPPRYADQRPIPVVQPSATPTIQGTPLPEFEVERPRRRPPPPPAPDRPVEHPAYETAPVSSTDIEIELDDRSLADIAFESSANLPVMRSEDLDPFGPTANRPSPPHPRSHPPPAAGRPGVPSRPNAGATVTGVGPASGPSAPAAHPNGPYQPRATHRPVRERGRPQPGTAAAAGRPEQGLNLHEKAELLYREAMKEAAVGNVAAARRHLQLALSFAPRHPQYTRALQSLKGR